MSDSTFKILLTTDNHLGYAERDPRRGDDSFTTFEEVLRAARTEHDVDMMLLGGDLFHENKPSLGCLVRSCSLFRKYVYGSKDIAFSLLSDPAINFPTHALPMANFQDPNVNVALPVFAIHGNHDDPVGGTSSLDLLATNGYLNYFGHVTSLEDIVVEPVLLRKGGTFIALYGLGNVRDERLHRCFRLKKVSFVYPKPVPGRRWFNILLLHQNRGVRGAASKNGILESMLAGFGMDLVIWGNEHEQLMVPQPADGFDVVQPGSTVLTSLSVQECNPKQYGILEVRGTSYRLTPYMLRSVRPVVRRTVELREDLPDGRTLDAVESFLHRIMGEMISEAEEQVRFIPDDVLTFHPNLKYPLVRLAVDFSDVTSAPYPQPNFNRFGQQYMDVVANPGEVLRPVKPKPERRAVGTVLGPAGTAAALVVPTAPQLNTLDIRVKVADVFNNNAKNACTLLSESELSAAVYAFAEKGERDAIDERLLELLHTSQKSVWRRMESGASDLILNPERVVEEVVTHKRHVNERYARAAQMEDAQRQQQQQQADDEEGEGEAEANEGGSAARRREGTAAAASSLSSTFQSEGRRHPLDAFETVRAAAATAAGASASAVRSTAHTDPTDASLAHRGGGDGGFGAQTDVASLVRDAIQHGESLTHRAADNAAPARRTDAGGAGNEEDEELPGDGLDRVPIDSVVAQAVQQQQQLAGLPAKRPRSAGAGGEGEDDTSRAIAVDVDDEDENGMRNRMVTAPPAAAKKQRTTSTRAATGAGRRRGGGGGGAADRADGIGASRAVNSGGPTLTLMAHQGSSLSSTRSGGGGGSDGAARGRPAPNNGRAAPPAPSTAANGAMLDLLSKWTNASQQK